MITGWLKGRATATEDGAVTLGAAERSGLAARLRRAYSWIVDHAIVCPYVDMEFGDPIVLGTGEARVEVRRKASYSSTVLLPLLNLATSQRLLFVGAPGRGKTTVATLMALLAGETLEEIRLATQHGQPQLTVTDLLGTPLPADLIRADSLAAIRVAWRRWIEKRVKIVDEYNRIPTKTQSALLSLMSEGYTEMYEQVVRTGKSAWFLTANDDLGGGTFQVIQALQDRIDIVARAVPFNARYLSALEERVTGAHHPLDAVPEDIVFSPADLDAMERAIRAVPVPPAVLDAIAMLAGQLDFCMRASHQLEHMNKDTLHLARRTLASVCNEDCPLDKQENLCSQSDNGISARAHLALLLYAKALAWFRDQSAVSVEDVRQLLPWVLHDRLRPNLHSAFFQKADNATLQIDRAAWIRQLFDRALAQHAATAKARGALISLRARLDADPSDLPAPELRLRLGEIERHISDVLRKNELNGIVYEDLIVLKGFHAHYRARLDRAERAV